MTETEHEIINELVEHIHLIKTDNLKNHAKLITIAENTYKLYSQILSRQNKIIELLEK